ncbi:hypothetical protein JYK14_02925 [Siccirubricoccus sp. KC 17139]|uniref:Uncharacterized protein n=1 Tax=Siccirubricoccus soli TaxID=2899147 RepID=A0ABT1CZN5_9PROT|nr:hypothetical protein [Siccirubricoccus soli]MCO6415130.1 hypothetical protein [Siccirubricoccus soli]MCP2681261.1 hypothetical protein [Siccirubricoccus soli]
MIHPQLGEIRTDANLRRTMRDFPPLAWFTTKIDVPRTLLHSSFLLEDKITGQLREVTRDPRLVNAIALNRVALGFPIASIPVIPWRNHPGYGTGEGRELNTTARDAGDNPDDWYVSETPVDILAASEIWTSSSIMSPKLKRLPEYLLHVRLMVQKCRDKPGTFIPPTWMKVEQQLELARRAGVQVFDPSSP